MKNIWYRDLLMHCKGTYIQLRVTPNDDSTMSHEVQDWILEDDRLTWRLQTLNFDQHCNICHSKIGFSVYIPRFPLEYCKPSGTWFGKWYFQLFWQVVAQIRKPDFVELSLERGQNSECSMASISWNWTCLFWNNLFPQFQTISWKSLTLFLLGGMQMLRFGTV